jgi:hypothetical protein
MPDHAPAPGTARGALEIVDDCVHLWGPGTTTSSSAAEVSAVAKLRRAPVEVTLVDRRNFHLFQPLTYQVATGALSPGEIAYP